MKARITDEQERALVNTHVCANEMVGDECRVCYLANALAAMTEQRDEFKARERRVRGGDVPRLPDNCSDCGRAMVWQRDQTVGHYHGSWMCPNCVLTNLNAARALLAKLRSVLHLERVAGECCHVCRNLMHIPDGLDATPECNACAQIVLQDSRDVLNESATGYETLRAWAAELLWEFIVDSNLGIEHLRDRERANSYAAQKVFVEERSPDRDPAA